MSKDIKEAAKQYAEIETKNVLHVRATKERFAVTRTFAERSFIAGAEWQSRQSPWISVKDAIPNKQAKGMCQVKFVDGSIDEMAMREVNKWIYPYIKTGHVTHWKPIPSFDEILEANKDVLERIKEKGD